MLFIDTRQFKCGAQKPVHLPALSTVSITHINKLLTPFVYSGARLYREDSEQIIHGYTMSVMGMIVSMFEDYFGFYEWETDFRERPIGAIPTTDKLIGHDIHRANKNICLVGMNVASLLPEYRRIIEPIPRHHLNVLSPDGLFPLGAVVEVLGERENALGFIKAGELGSKDGKPFVLLEIRPIDPSPSWFQKDMTMIMGDDIPLRRVTSTPELEERVELSRPKIIKKKAKPLPPGSPFVHNSIATSPQAIL